MKKIVLINSYSDRNKGDLGIILGTINTIKSKFSDCTIDAVSSFSYKDEWFHSEHIELKKYINKIYPTIIGRVYAKSFVGKIFMVIKDIIKSIIIEFSPMWFLNIYLKMFYNQTRKVIISSDLIISKGGSFICNKNNFIDKLRLSRELAIFRLCLRYNKKIIIWGQSIGPVYGKIDLFRTRNLLKKIHLIILREELCLLSYNNLFNGLNNIKIGNDLAFNLEYKKSFKENKPIHKKEKCKVAFTLKNYNNVNSNNLYFSLLKKIIYHLNKNYNCIFHFVPHVSIDDDLNQVKKFVEPLFATIDKNKIIVDENEYSINELLKIYETKDILIGTRLHSTIFALSTNTRVINIGYHATKAKGVFNKIGLSNFQFDIDDPTDGILPKIDELLMSEFDFSKKLQEIKTENRNIIDLF